MWLEAVALWVAIGGLAACNGWVRERVLVPKLGPVAGMVLSGLILSTVIVFVTWLAVPRWGPRPRITWLELGALWLLFTLAFEFGFGRAVRRKRWSDLFAAYTFKDGNLWPLVVVTTLLAPWLAALARGMVQ